VAKPSLERVLRSGDKGIMEAYREHGYTMKQVAEHLGIHYAKVSRRLRKLDTTKKHV
jgi:DNA-directed RNA polymerase specialized sigma subunit